MKRLLSMILSAVLAPAASAALLVTEVTGTVEIEGKGQVATLAELPDGSRLAVPVSSQVVVVDLHSGREFVLPGGGKYIVSSDGPRTAGGTAVVAKSLPASNLPSVRIAPGKAAQGTLVMRGARKTQVPLLISPVRTATLTETPVFRWNAVEDATSYRLIVTVADGTTVWDISTRDTELSLPSDRHLQAGQRYLWRVEAIGESGRLSDASAGFAVAGTDAIARLALLKPDVDSPFARRVLYAAQLREAGALEEAREIWKSLAKERPQDPVLNALTE